MLIAPASGFAFGAAPVPVRRLQLARDRRQRQQLGPGVGLGPQFVVVLLLRHPDRADPLGVEELPHDRLRAGQQHLPRTEHGQVPVVDQADVVRHGPGRVDVVRDDQERRVGLLVEVDDELVQVRRTHRIQSGVGLVEEDDLRLEHQRAGQPGPLAHAAGDLAGQLLLGAGQADHVELRRRRWPGCATRTGGCARAAETPRCRRCSSSRTTRRPGTAPRRACGRRTGGARATCGRS